VPHALLMVLPAAPRGTAVGQIIRRHLTTLSQRGGGEQAPELGRQLSACPPLRAQRLPAGRRADAPAVVATVVLGPLALTRPWLAAVDRDLQRLPDKIISRCFGGCWAP
jgi:hypothetical protein